MDFFRTTNGQSVLVNSLEMIARHQSRLLDGNVSWLVPGIDNDYPRMKPLAVENIPALNSVDMGPQIELLDEIEIDSTLENQIPYNRYKRLGFDAQQIDAHLPISQCEYGSDPQQLVSFRICIRSRSGC